MRHLRLITAALAVTVSSSRAQSRADPDLDHHLFVGIDLVVQHDDSLIPVKSLEKNRVNLTDPNTPQLSLSNAGRMGRRKVPKLSNQLVTIEGFDARAAYSVSDDPAMGAMRVQSNAIAYQQERSAYLHADLHRIARGDSARTGATIHAANEANAGRQTTGPNDSRIGAGGAASISAGGYSEAFIEALGRLVNSYSDETVSRDSAFFNRLHHDAKDEEGTHSAMDLSFLVSSPQPLENTYVVVLAKLAKGDIEDVVTFHKVLGRIDAKPRKVSIRKTGLVRGFTIVDVKLHLYSHGHELATDLSHRHTPLTREDARHYLTLRHLSKHATESMPAQPVWSIAPNALFAAKKPGVFEHDVVVNIDADGSLISIHESMSDAQTFLASIHDAADLRSKSTPGKTLTLPSAVIASAGKASSYDQTGRLPPTLVAALREMTFLPALEGGTAVPGTTRLNLVDFFR